MDQDRFLELLIKKRFNAATLQDIAELKEYLKSNDYDLTNDGDLIKLPEFNIATNSLSDEVLENKWENFHKNISVSVEKRKSVPFLRSIKFLKPRWLNYAAILVAVFISSGLWFWNHVIEKPTKQIIVNTKYGSKSKIQMPDGTVIWLNAGSKLTYDEEYGKSNRNVNLIGEAFFDVKDDVSYPFIICTKDLSLKVLGTAFNVKAYSEDKTGETSLIRGSLEVSFPNTPTVVMCLMPNS